VIGGSAALKRHPGPPGHFRETAREGPITSYVIQRTDDEIDQVLNLAHDPEERGGTAYLGMSFERGVEWTLWARQWRAPLP
jgi:hypothetical protein